MAGSGLARLEAGPLNLKQDVAVACEQTLAAEGHVARFCVIRRRSCATRVQAMITLRSPSGAGARPRGQHFHGPEGPGQPCLNCACVTVALCRMTQRS